MRAEHGKLNSCATTLRSHALLRDRMLCLFRLAIVFLPCILFVNGCSRLQLPAIDPSGNSIFLPFPNTTGLDLPPLHSTPGRPGIIPNPAFTTPPTPPPCLDAGVCNLFGDKRNLCSKLQDHFNKRGKAGEIQLTPMVVVAPVGGEVVLLSGICGPDGYLVKREPLEWMLSPDSVGTFIEVGDDKPGTLSSFLLRDPKVEKLDVDFARGRTSSKRTLITRGSENCNDDIPLGEGQTWLSISSPSEGVSRVTVLAPDSEIWDRRRLTSTIYWVDAQWEFPRPEITRAGEPITLVTRVTKAENLVPAEDWFVDYQILDPTVATFVPRVDGNKARVRVDANGQAAVTIAALPDARGTTPVLVDVIRPAQPSDNLPELVLGRGQTTATFSAPGLVLEAFGPETTAVGSQTTYSAALGNPGDLNAENVMLTLRIPAGMKAISASLNPTRVASEFLQWNQGVLEANEQLDVSVTMEALQPNTVDVVFQASAEGLPPQERGIRTEVIAPSVDVRFAPEGGIAEAPVGTAVKYEIDVKNTGLSTLTDVVIAIRSAPGLPELNQGETAVEQTIPRIEPGQTVSIGVDFLVQQQGQLPAELEVKVGDNILGSRTTSILGLPERQKVPGIDVDIQFPEIIQAGGKNFAVITVRNTGELRLSDVRVEINFDESLSARRVDTVNEPRISMGSTARQLIWSAQDLLPRVGPNSPDIIRQLTIEFLSLAPIDRSTLNVRASAAEGVQAEDRTDFRSIASDVSPPVVPPGGQGGEVNPPVTPPGVDPPSVDPPAGSGPQRSGQLKVSIDDFGDPTIVGREIRYSLTIENDRDVADRNLGVQLRIPGDADFLGISLNGNDVSSRFVANRTLELENINSIRAGEQITYFFVLVPKIPQLMTIDAVVRSDGQPQGVTASETTTVNIR